jgi:hypothetical protein
MKLHRSPSVPSLRPSSASRNETFLTYRRGGTEPSLADAFEASLARGRHASLLQGTSTRSVPTPSAPQDARAVGHALQLDAPRPGEPFGGTDLIVLRDDFTGELPRNAVRPSCCITCTTSRARWRSIGTAAGI